MNPSSQSNTPPSVVGTDIAVNHESTETGSSSEIKELLLDLFDSGQLELPVLPEVSVQLLRLTNDPTCDAGELAELIRRDASIASNLLRIANSAMYSAGPAIVSLQQAIARLGFRKIREIVLIISCQNRVFDVHGFEGEVRLSFRRSLGAASFAQEIARLCRLNVEESFLCGLLHDIGRPVLLQALVDVQNERNLIFRREDILATVNDLSVDFGGDLISSWSLPKRVADVVRSQNEPGLVADVRQNAFLLRFAIDLATSTLEGSSDNTDAVSHHSSIPHLNLYPEQMETLLSKQDDVRQWVESSV